ncbi:MAG: hypothetical protein ACI4UM_01945 [Succinivibrio sp.]
MKLNYLFIIIPLMMLPTGIALAKDSSTDNGDSKVQTADVSKIQKSQELDKKRSDLRKSLKKDSADYMQRKALAKEKKRDQIAAEEFYDSYHKYENVIHPEEEKESEKTDLVFLDDRAEKFRKWVDENMRLNFDKDKKESQSEQSTQSSDTEEIKVKNLDDLFSDDSLSNQ